MQYLMAIDQGTTSSRAIIFEPSGTIKGIGQQEFNQFYPQEGWVEHDADEIWQSVLSVCRAALKDAGLAASDITAIGITNQRETTVLWNKQSGEVLGRAIVWQDRRTAAYCQELKAANHEAEVTAKTGLLLDPYFSGTKLKWLLDAAPDRRAAAETGDLAFGTIDSFLIWRLTGGAVHATDATNAARTLLFNIHSQEWDADLLALLHIPEQILPTVKDSADDYGACDPALFGAAIPIRGVAGDQQAALFGQACYHPGDIKSTYGTGCFAILNTGDKPVTSQNKLLTTVGYRINGQVTYALEGSIFVAGAAVKWLRDKVRLIDDASETESLAKSKEDTGGTYLIPAFAGLGAPYWDPNARGALIGMTLDTDQTDIIRAALEAVAYQTRDLLTAMADDGADVPQVLRVDGGMVANDWLMQFLSDILAISVDRPVIAETTALGAAYLAGLSVGIYSSLDEIAENWRLDQNFAPMMPQKRRDDLYDGWLSAVERVR